MEQAPRVPGCILMWGQYSKSVLLRDGLSLNISRQWLSASHNSKEQQRSRDYVTYGKQGRPQIRCSRSSSYLRQSKPNPAVGSGVSPPKGMEGIRLHADIHLLVKAA